MSEWKKEEKTYTIYPEHLEPEDYLKVLLCEDVLFINNGWWFEKENKPWQKDYITVHVNCNDVFAWGAADAENITYHELQDLYEHYKKDPNWGPAIWCIKKRKMKPQKPVEDSIIKLGIWDLKEIYKEF